MGGPREWDGGKETCEVSHGEGNTRPSAGLGRGGRRAAEMESNEGTEEMAGVGGKTDAENRGGERMGWREPERRREAAWSTEKTEAAETEKESRDQPGFLKHGMRAPDGYIALGRNANSTGKCKCKEALRALCANIRPGSAAPAELPGTPAPPCPGPRANSLCCHLPGGSGRRGQGARTGHKAPRGPGVAALPNGAKDRSAEARQVGLEGERGMKSEEERRTRSKVLGQAPGLPPAAGRL